MIQPLRTYHRGAFILIAVLVLAILVASLGLRHAPLPDNPALSASRP